MTKSALLIKMIDLLRNRPGITVSELSRELERSERTIYRWLNEVCVDLKTPLFCENGGYYLAASQEEKRTDLTPQELLALRLSLKSSPFAEGSPIRKHAESAWLKIRDSFAGENVEELAQLTASHDVVVSAPKADISAEVVEAIDRAITEHSRLKARYRSQKSNRIKDYLLDPYAVVFRRHSWYLVGYSHEHEKAVQFKLARFIDVKETGDKFDPPDGFSLQNYFQYSWESWGGGEPTRVRVRFSPRVAAMVAEVERHPTQKVTQQEDGSVIFEATVSGIREIAIWIMGYGKNAEVLEPESLREYIFDQVKGMIENYVDNNKTIEDISKS